MNQYSWVSLMDMPDINECFNTFSITILDIFNRNFLYKELTKKALDVSKPYISREISTLIQEKHKLQKLYRKYPIKYKVEPTIRTISASVQVTINFI